MSIFPMQRSLLDPKADENDIFFEVRTAPVQSEGIRAEDYLAVIREDTRKVIGIVGSNYKLVPNRQVVDAFEKALEESDFNTEGMVHQDELAYEGRMMVRTYTLPAHSHQVAGEEVQLTLRLVNSYDGTAAFRAIVGGAYNGRTLSIAQRYNEMSRRHTSGLDAESMSSQIAMSLTLYEKHTQQWDQWSKTRISEDLVWQVTAEMGVGDRTAESIYSGYLRQSAKYGPTAWALFNALSAWAAEPPSREASRANQAAVQLQREQRVQKALSSKEIAAKLKPRTDAPERRWGESGPNM